MKRTINKKTLVAIAIILAIGAVGIVVLTNIDRIAIQFAPKKQAATSRSEDGQES